MVQATPMLVTPRRREALVDELVREVGLGRRLVSMITVMTAGAALYGVVVGMWRGEGQAVYAAVKLPLVLLLTSGLTMLFNWMTAVRLGVRTSFLQVAALTHLALAVAGVVLASLVPVAWLFTSSAEPPSPAARTTHNLLYLLHTGLVGFSGLVGVSVLWGALLRVAGDPRRARRVFLIWLLTYALVGGEVAWALRPFVGSIYSPVGFLREDALDGNVYEFILRDIVPHFWNVLTNGGH